MNKNELSAGTKDEQRTDADNSTSASLAQNGLLAEVPVRVQRSRQHKQVSPNGLPIIYVGRPTKFGNPFKVGYKGLTASDCLNLYRIHAKKIPDAELEKLKGKNLSCWCKVGEPCHADVLLELANG